MKIALILFVAMIPFCVCGAQAVKKAEAPKPMKLFVEIDGKLYEVFVEKKDMPHGVEPANAEVQKKFNKEAKRFGIAYIQDKLRLIKKEFEKTGQ